MSVLDSVNLSPLQRNTLEQATARYETEVENLASYLGERGIDRGAAISRRLGYVSSPMPGHERFVGYVALPYLTAGGGVVAIKFRCARSHDCKAVGCQRYDAPAGQGARLYGADTLANGGETAAVVEGEFKAIIVQRMLGIPAVGTSAGVWMDHWPRTLADFQKVLVIADNDDPGLKHAKDKVLKSLPQGQLVVPPAEFPKIDDWIVSQGADAVREAIGL